MRFGDSGTTMTSMSGSIRGARTLAVVVSAAVVGSAAVSACSSSDSVSPVTTMPVLFTTTTTPTTTTTVPGTTTSSTSTTSTSTTSTSTTTTEPLAVQELLLRGDGIGAALFGADPEGVIGYVTSIIGGNTSDTGWVDPFTFADCGAGGTATIARRVDWGVLSLLFSDASTYAIGRRHFIGFEYGRVGQIGDEPQGLRTPGGVALGSRVVDLVAEFPEVKINDGEPDLGIPDNYYVSDVFYGLLTGTSNDDVVTVMFGGYGCGE